MEENKIISYKGFDENMQCHWKPIKGYEGLYLVSEFGEVKSLSRNIKSGRSYGLRTSKEHILKQTSDKDGYKIVFLCKNGAAKPYRVHRIVAQAFLDNPRNFPIVNHKDENKANNNVLNLEWCSVSYNNHYGRGYDKERFMKQKKEVKQISLQHKLVCVFESLSDASKAVNGNRNTIALHIKNKKPYLGYLWA